MVGIAEHIFHDKADAVVVVFVVIVFPLSITIHPQHDPLLVPIHSSSMDRTSNVQHGGGYVIPSWPSSYPC